jgi:hypothetical protein
LPAERITRIRVVALLSLGMLWAGTVRINQVAAALPLGVRVPSTERRLRRFLANAAVSPQRPWWPLLPVLLRVNVSAGQSHRLHLLDAAGGAGPEEGLWAVVGTVPSGWHAPAQICMGSGWRTGELTVCQRPGMTECGSSSAVVLEGGTASARTPAMPAWKRPSPMARRGAGGWSSAA